MNIKNVSLLTILSLYSALSHGMENNDFDKSFVGMLHNVARQQVQTLNKNLKKDQRKKIDRSDITETKKLLFSDETKTITSEEKNLLHALLTKNNQLLGECYSADETWSETDLSDFHNREILIGVLKPEIIIK